MTKLKIKKAVKARIADIIDNQAGERSIILEEVLNKMNAIKKKTFIDKIVYYISLDVKQHKVLKEDLDFAIDDYLLCSQEYIDEFEKGRL